MCQTPENNEKKIIDNAYTLKYYKCVKIEKWFVTSREALPKADSCF